MNFSQQSFRPLFVFALIVAAVFALSFTAKPADAAPLSKEDSELTLLMRQMYDDVANMKTAVKRRKKPTPAVAHERMLKATASEPAKTASPAYAALAQSYLKALQALQDANPADAPALYKNLVDSCMSCHSAFCPGPKMRIQNLY
jgi:cytochrome c556